MPETKQVHVVISGTLQYEADIDLSKAIEVVKFLELGTPLDTPQRTAADEIVMKAPPKHQTATAHQAIESSKAKTNPQKIVALAHNGPGAEGSTFKADDIQPLFKQARERTPKNLTRDISTAVKSGWLADGDESGTYYITNAGVSAVESGFNQS